MQEWHIAEVRKINDVCRKSKHTKLCREPETLLHMCMLHCCILSRSEGPRTVRTVLFPTPCNFLAFYPCGGMVQRFGLPLQCKASRASEWSRTHTGRDAAKIMQYSARKTKPWWIRNFRVRRKIKAGDWTQHSWKKKTLREVLRCAFNTATSRSEAMPFIMSVNTGSDWDFIQFFTKLCN